MLFFISRSTTCASMGFTNRINNSSQTLDQGILIGLSSQFCYTCLGYFNVDSSTFEIYLKSYTLPWLRVKCEIIYYFMHALK